MAVCVHCKRRMLVGRLIARERLVHFRCAVGLARVLWALVDEAAAPRENTTLLDSHRGHFSMAVWVKKARVVLGWPDA